MREGKGKKENRARDCRLGRNIENEFNCTPKLCNLNMK